VRYKKIENLANTIKKKKKKKNSFPLVVEISDCILYKKEPTLLAIYVVIEVKALNEIMRFKCSSRDPKKSSR
jgi:hypothetical protein